MQKANRKIIEKRNSIPVFDGTMENSEKQEASVANRLWKLLEPLRIHVMFDFYFIKQITMKSCYVQLPYSNATG